MSIKTLGSSSHTDDDREKNDFYATNPDDMQSFLSALKRDNITLSDRIWECSAGQKHISNVLEEKGHEVLSTDLIIRCNGVLQHDFISPLFMSQDVREHLDHTKKWNGDILTNPPYSYVTEFFETGMNLIHFGSKLIFLLPSRYLEGKGRYIDIYRDNPPKYIYQYTYRINIGKNAIFDAGNAVSYCWIMWEKGFKGDPRFRWIE